MSTFTSLETPLGSLRVDTKGVSPLTAASDLIASGSISPLRKDTDIAEHSLEMHMPYLRHVFRRHDVCVVPIAVGVLRNSGACADALAELLSDASTAAVISSDFCHWGLRFRYTRYQAPGTRAISLDTQTPPSVYAKYPIFKSIADLDQDALRVIAIEDGDAQQAAEDFADYIHDTRNTICGRSPILLLLHTLARMDTKYSCKLMRYEQSGTCRSAADSSVSYASVVIQARSA